MQAIPGWWVWIWYVNPVAWSLYGIIASQMGNFDSVEDGYGIPDPFNDDKVISVAQLLHDTLGYSHDMIGWVALIMVGFAGSFCILSMIALKRFNFQNR